MTENRELVCTLCPNGCTLSAAVDGGRLLSVIGALCSRGRRFAAEEVRNPLRVLTTTVRVRNGELPLVSVRSDRPIPLRKMKEAVAYLRGIELEAPVDFHQPVCRRILGLDADILATRAVASVSC